ncbi:MAG: hypothetical protein ACI9Y8_001914 [Candidatus Omnitrophota bacterium]|jgi:hypothetical protein
MTVPDSSSDKGSSTPRMNLSEFKLFKNVTLILTAVALIAAGNLILSTTVSLFKLANINNYFLAAERQSVSASQTTNSLSVDANAQSTVEPGLTNRNVFLPVELNDSSPLNSATAVYNPASSYKLVGISESSNRSDTFVMVENVRTKMTFLLPYDQVVEGLELEEVIGNKVRVKIGGTSVELE